jgi:alpha-beta hydrolase superfamily lysophospholipase
MPKWVEPETPPRGAVVVVGGRGETEAVYRRLARRLAFDGYRIAVVGPADAEGSSLDEAGVIREIRALIRQADPASPVVLIGSDTGAAAVVRAATGAPVAGVVLAGLLTDSAAEGPADWGDELDIRSACPVHRGVLAGVADAGGAVVPGRLAVGGGALDAADVAALTVPVLAVHGDGDRVSPVAEAATVLAGASDAQVVFVVDGRHDILNDVSHRSVAAAIVQFLERLRVPGAAPILRGGDAADLPLAGRVG